MASVPYLSWSELEAIARSLPPKTNLVIPKSAAPASVPWHRSRMGRPYGALRQFRDARRHRNLHVKEYPDRWVLHVDTWNPRTNPLLHLLVDHGYKAFVDLAHWLEHVRPDSDRAAAPSPA